VRLTVLLLASWVDPNQFPDIVCDFSSVHVAILQKEPSVGYLCRNQADDFFS